MPTDLAISYPSELPITDRKDDLLAAIEANQVLVVAGETGSGKSTQLPKMCLELGRGIDGWVGHTQPRRIAARTIAERVASELDTPLGSTVGYTVRFNDRVGPDTRIKLMTDGILLAEIARDRSLKRYDTIIIDEAHERSLNIDFILGYLKQLLPRRPDLKVIITSATIDTGRFSEHFDGAPIIEVSGRGYPVELRYEPLERPERVTSLDQNGVKSLDQNEGITKAVSQLWREQPGDVLVFCSGEREIRDAAEAVTELKLPGAEVLPLYARLSSAEQQRVFRQHSKRRVVIATNVAETSVTVPGIRSVVDVGTARISRYSNRTKVQRLPIERISQASANQRAGRCGRLGPGVCIRLYAEDDFDARDEFTEPEIQRTNLASVILQMASLGLGRIEDFPFVDRPDPRSIKDGIDLLIELDALDPSKEGTKKWLTTIGRELSKLPVDPRYGRMLIEADENNCLSEVMIIVSGLSVQDPRERPQDNKQQADESHKRFEDDSSDFFAYLKLWDHLETARRERSRNQFRRMCRREFLNYNRIVEWQDIHKQLRQVTRELKFRHAGASSKLTSNDRNDDQNHRDFIHRSILSGLLSQIGMKLASTGSKASEQPNSASGRGRPKPSRKRSEYQGARNSRFAIAPGSALFAKSPNWVMAAELVETNRLWARVVTGLNPAWVEELGGHLATYTYGDPWWDIDRGSAMVKERVTLYGLTLAANRGVHLGSVDAALARELFIHHALVEGEWNSNHRFITRNRELITEIEALEARSRRRDLLVERRSVFDFYDQRLPDDIISTDHFNSWWAKRRRREPDLLNLTSDVLLNPEAGHVSDDDFPDSWIHSDLDLELAYEFDPNSHLDGLSVLVPVEVLNQIDETDFQWLVPGLRTELIGALIRSLPKAKRRLFVPAAETVDQLLPRLDPSRGALLDAVAIELGQHGSTVITVDDFSLDKIPRHLRPTFRVINDNYELLAEGKDIARLRSELTDEVRRTLSKLVAADNDWEQAGLRTWSFGTLPRVVETGSVKAFPAVVDEVDSVAVRLQATEDDQHDAMWSGVRRLLRFTVAAPARRLDERLDDHTKLLLVKGHVQSKAEWYNDAIAAALDASIVKFGGPSWNQAAFEALAAATGEEFDDHLQVAAEAISRIVAALDQVHAKLDHVRSDTYQLSVDDIRAHLGRLAYPGLLAGVGLERVDDVARYLEAISLRLDGLVKNPTRDLEALALCRRLDNELAELSNTRSWSQELEDTVWLLEELRVSQFAQGLKAKGKVSEKRVRRALNSLRAP